MASTRQKQLFLGATLIAGGIALYFLTRDKSGVLKVEASNAVQYPVTILVEQQGQNIHFDPNFAKDGEITLPPGTYTLTIKKQGFLSAVQQIVIEKNKVSTVKFLLQPASLNCNQPNAVRCNGKDVEKCVAGSWVPQQTCAQACSQGACQTLNTCTQPGLKRCSPTNQNVIEECQNGVFTPVQNCPSGCSGGGCNPLPGQCVGSVTRCNPQNPNVLQMCSNGTFQDVQTCAFGCANGACQSQSSQCGPDGIKRCNGNTVQQCVNGNWQGIQSCGFGCAFGVCLPPPSSCSPNNATRCDPQNPNVLQQCINGKWTGIQSCANCVNGRCV